MGRFRFDGPGAASFLDSIVSRRVTNIKPDQIRYGLITNDDGGILDDVLVYHLVDHDGSPFHFMVVNAGNRDKINEWLAPRLAKANDVTFTDQSLDTAMIAVQGPAAVELADGLCDLKVSEIPYYLSLIHI